MYSIWTEKYRPQTFSEIKGQEHIIQRTQSMVENQNIPNLLFAGPPGVGKSTLALVIAKQLYKETWKQNFLELNASDERGIDVVRNTIKDFARTKAMSGPFKIIFLDECDSLTKDAQQALRRTMETFSKNTRFVLSANYSSKIIEPIQSRCTVLRFKPLTKEETKEIINNIAKKEKLELTKESMQALYEISEGDARKIGNMLQSSAAISRSITPDLIYQLVSAAKPKEINDILNTAIKGDFITARNKLLDTMLRHGLSGFDMIKQIQKEIWNLNIEEKEKVKLIDKCGEIEFRMVEGSDEYLQLEALLSNFIKNVD